MAVNFSRFVLLRLQGAHLDSPIFNDKGAPSAPPPPDPNAQIEAEARANRINVNSPYGTVHWQEAPKKDTLEEFALRTGQARGDPVGQRIEQTPDGGTKVTNLFDPQSYANEYANYASDYDMKFPGGAGWTQDINLSPEQQKLLQGRQSIATELLDRGDQYAKQPYEFKGAEDDTANRFFQNQKKLLDTAFDRDEERERQRLFNQGIPEDAGNADSAYTKDMDDFARRKADAYSSAAANALQEGFRQDLTTRQQNVNEIASALGGQQLTPAGTSGTGNPLDTSSAFANYNQGVNRQYQGQLAGFNAQTAGNNQAAGAAASIIAAAMMSDRRLKTDIVLLGEFMPGVNLYEFRYKSGNRRHVGVMADEVEQVMPRAIFESEDGYKAVDYGVIIAQHAVHAEMRAQ